MDYLILKRFMDLILSILGLFILSPLLLFLAVAIKLDSKGNIFFIQKRVGRNKEYFNILKFRTMYFDTPSEVPTHLLGDSRKHITKVGRILRKSSLDELPQILNIIRGDMSIVGPRPALWNQDDLILARDLYGANKVRPGLTSWAQINGRDELSVDIKAEFDGEYVKDMVFLFDVRCFTGTFFNILKRAGVVEGSDDKEELINK